MNLKTINEELDKIASQGPLLPWIYSDLSTSAPLDRLSIALEKFKVCLTSDVTYIVFAVDITLSPAC